MPSYIGMSVFYTLDISKLVWKNLPQIQHVMTHKTNHVYYLNKPYIF